MFKKSTTVFISDEYKDGSKKIPEGTTAAKRNNAEEAIAAAYVSYLFKQGIKLYPDDTDILIEHIENSLKRYKREAKKKSII